MPKLIVVSGDKIKKLGKGEIGIEGLTDTDTTSDTSSPNSGSVSGNDEDGFEVTFGKELFPTE